MRRPLNFNSHDHNQHAAEMAPQRRGGRPVTADNILSANPADPAQTHVLVTQLDMAAMVFHHKRIAARANLDAWTSAETRAQALLQIGLVNPIARGQPCAPTCWGRGQSRSRRPSQSTNRIP